MPTTPTTTTTTTIYESAPIPAERKMLRFLVGRNDRGTFAKIIETTASGRVDSIVLAASALVPLRDAITAALARLSADHLGESFDAYVQGR